MIPEERRNQIINKLKKKNIYTINNLTKELNVSRVTVQRDLIFLEKEGYVEKIYGGVKLRNENVQYYTPRFNIRLRQNYEKKKEIAKKALNYIYNDYTIFLDHSTTAYTFAEELLKKQFINLTIISISPAILYESSKYNEHKVISTSGELINNLNMLAGSWVIDFLEKINIDAAFISAGGISDNGEVSTFNTEIASILQMVFKKSNEVNLLIDSTKIFKTCMLSIAPLSMCKRIITDRSVDCNTVSRLQEFGNFELVY